MKLSIFPTFLAFLALCPAADLARRPESEVARASAGTSRNGAATSLRRS